MFNCYNLAVIVVAVFVIKFASVCSAYEAPISLSSCNHKEPGGPLIYLYSYVLMFMQVTGLDKLATDLLRKRLYIYLINYNYVYFN